MSALAAIAGAAVAVLVVGWLYVSFAAPGPRRKLVERVAATALFVALWCLFAHLLGRARAADNLLATIGFGFLVLFFSAGLLLSAWKIVAQLRGVEGGDAGATN